MSDFHLRPFAPTGRQLVHFPVGNLTCLVQDDPGVLYLPGSHIPVLTPAQVAESRPDYLLILPWNLRDEIAAQMAGIREWGGQFVVPIPRVEVF